MDASEQGVGAARLENRLRRTETYVSGRLLCSSDAGAVRGIIRLQARARGAAARELSRVVITPRLHINAPALRSVTHEMQAMRAGWFHCIGNVLLLVFVSLLAYVQVFSFSSPGALEQQVSALASGVTLADGRGPDALYSAADISNYVAALLEALYSPDPVVAPLCNASASCAGPLWDPAYWDTCAQVTNLSGFFGSFARLETGLSVTQTRYATGPCTPTASQGSLLKASGGDYNSLCASGRTVAEYNSSYFAANPGARQQVPPNIGDGPFTFDSAKQGFTITLDLGLANLAISDELCNWGYLQSIDWIDRATAAVSLRVTFYNSNFDGNMCILYVGFWLDLTGTVRSSISAVGVNLHGPENLVWLYVFTALYGVYAAVNLSRILLRATTSRDARRRCLCWHGRTRVWSPSTWFLESAVAVMHVVCISLFAVFIAASDRFIQLQPGPYVLDPGLKEPDDVTTAIVNLDYWASALRIAYGALLYLLCFRTIDSFDFHVDLGVVSSTAKLAAEDIAVWSVVWFSVTLIFAWMGVLWFGNFDPLFVSFPQGIVSLAYMSILLLSDPLSVNLQGGALLQWFIWSFIALNTVLLFNIVLAILWDSYCTCCLTTKGKLLAGVQDRVR
jgi:hypothetical protein